MSARALELLNIFIFAVAAVTDSFFSIIVFRDAIELTRPCFDFVTGTANTLLSSAFSTFSIRIHGADIVYILKGLSCVRAETHEADATLAFVFTVAFDTDASILDISTRKFTRASRGLLIR